MYTVFVAATLALGLGDGRNGAMDGRTINEGVAVPLVVGMDWDKAAHSLRQTWHVAFFTGKCVVYQTKLPDRSGIRWRLALFPDRDGRVGQWTVEALPVGCTALIPW
jgi:hypothetical protein